MLSNFQDISATAIYCKFFHSTSKVQIFENLVFSDKLSQFWTQLCLLCVLDTWFFTISAKIVDLFLRWVWGGKLSKRNDFVHYQKPRQSSLWCDFDGRNFSILMEGKNVLQGCSVTKIAKVGPMYCSIWGKSIRRLEQRDVEHQRRA